MPDGLKKIVKCVSCPAQYNIAQFAPGTKFKCQKCGAVNVVPAAAPAPVVPVTQPKPIQPGGTTPPRKQTTPPAQITPAAPAVPPPLGRRPTIAIKKNTPSLPGRPSTKRTAFSSLKRTTPGTSKFLRKPATVAAGSQGEDNGLVIIDEKKKSKKKLFLIIGIAGVVIAVVVVIMALAGVFSGPTDKDSDEKDFISRKSRKREADKTKTEEPSSKTSETPKSVEK